MGFFVVRTGGSWERIAPIRNGPSESCSGGGFRYERVKDNGSVELSTIGKLEKEKCLGNEGDFDSAKVREESVRLWGKDRSKTNNPKVVANALGGRSHAGRVRRNCHSLKQLS